MKFDILNRFTGMVKFTAEIDCEEKALKSLKLGLAVKWAIANKANLTGANLTEANLTGANLTEANLTGANLTEANLTGANLTGANLTGANLRGANLTEANLTEADLTGANLRWADLRWANLTEADLTEANLTGADKCSHGPAIITMQPICIYSGLRWPVMIFDDYMLVGCELHPLSDWQGFSDRRILEMDGKDAAIFWKTNKEWLLGLAKSNGRSFVEPKERNE